MNEIPLSNTARLIITLALSAATFMFVLDYSIANVSIPYISGDLAVAVDQGTYVITSFSVGNAITLLITGWLTKRIGAVRLICLSLLLFTLFSWTCGAAVNIETLVISRFLQGVASGPMIPLSQTLLLLITPKEKRMGAMALWSTIVITAPIVGPILGGWISYDYVWPWIFYINIPIGLLSAAILWSSLKGRETPKEKDPPDWVSLSLLVIAVTSLQFLLDKGEQYDWLRSNLILTCSITSAVSFILLIIWSLTYPRPLINLSLFKIRSFAISVVYIAIIYAIYFGSIVLVPLWLQTSMNYTSIWAGIAVAPMGIAPFLIGPFMGKAMNRFGSIKLLSICCILLAISCFYTAYFDTDVDIWHIGLSRFLLGCGLVFFITPLFALSVQDIPEENLANSTGIFHFTRAMMGGVGTSIFTTLWMRRSALHHAFIGENLTDYSPQTSRYLNQLSEWGLPQEKALEQLNNTLTQQGQMLGINDCFFAMGGVFLILLIFLPFSRLKHKKSVKHQEYSAAE